MRIQNVSYKAYRNTKEDFQGSKVSFGRSPTLLNTTQIYSVKKIRSLLFESTKKLYLTPFSVKAEKYYANKYFKPQAVFADYIFVPEKESLDKGTYYAKKFFELRGQIKKGAKVFFDDNFESSKGSIIEGEITGRCADIDGEVLNAKIEANYVHLGLNSNTENSQVEAVSKVHYDKKQQRNGSFLHIPSTIAGELKVDGKVKNSDLKGYNAFINYDSIIDGGAISAEQNNYIGGIIRNAELIDGNYIHIFSGSGAEIVNSHINIFSNVALYSGGEVKPTPIRTGTICTRSKTETIDKTPQWLVDED